DMRHEGTRGRILSQFPPSVRERRHGVWRNDRFFHSLQLGCRKLPARDEFFHRDPPLPDSRRCGNCDWVLGAVRHFPERCNVARQVSHDMVADAVTTAVTRPAAHQLGVRRKLAPARIGDESSKLARIAEASVDRAASYFRQITKCFPTRDWTWQIEAR